MKRTVLIATTLSLSLIVGVAPASAAFHFIKIREVSAGAAADSGYVELQMYARGQTLVAGHHLRVYDAGGTVATDFIIPGPVTQGGNQRTILIADTARTPKDFHAAGLNLAALSPGGAVCFEALDCLSWGTFAGSLPASAGTPFPGSLPSTDALHRTITPGCPTLLEATDDTGDSATDFFLAPASPTTNLATPTETECVRPQTSIGDGPKKRTNSRRAKFKFSSSIPGSSFECRLDRKRWVECTSPKLYTRIKRGSHTFKARATADGLTDLTPATYGWKRKP